MKAPSRSSLSPHSPHLSHQPRLSVAARLGLSFTVILVMMLALAALAVLRVHGIERTLTNISDNNNVKQQYAVNFRGSVHDRAIAVRDLTLADDSHVDEIVSLIERLNADYQRSAGPMDALFTPANAGNVRPEEREDLAAIKAIEARTQPIITQVITLRRAGDLDGARRLVLDQARPAFVDWLAAINRMIDLEDRTSHTESMEAVASAHGFQNVMLALVIVALTCGAVMAFLITRQLRRALGAEPDDVKALALAVDRGELYHEFDLGHGASANGANRERDTSIMASLAEMATNLRRAVTQVRHASHDVTEISHRIASGNRDLAARTAEQASSLEQTAAAMEELTSTVSQNDENSRGANDLAHRAAEMAEQGGAMVEQVVTTMSSIDASSRKIVDIIAVIEGIAFQTNILALNAAVEAARAGEQGKGFAVVAAEVRSLAGRSSAAAKEVKQLIDASVSQVASGTTLVQNAGNTMREIVARVKQVSNAMDEISAASHEQKQGIEEVNRAIALMDQVTSHNAALVEDAGAAAQMLQQQAQALTLAVGRFHLEADDAALDATPAAFATSAQASNDAGHDAGAATRPVKVLRAG
ncbi:MULTISPECIES: methyl-accepting chemotaxis protein [Pandoraea]|uniref:methyl-accepting chemotaxis protein n=1 Tax=Pandoraea TaxID=93217 RepID=UPI001F5D1224|nr:MULTISPECIES: methyl-accepting chemotaxis protein [Pandoraea]MCI3204157.1 methyl-accepting chemotaxis protein [Pandoraea sp. LA3]MDN4582183.1 methyl-accepting chemotaxis protein [Pandoraea capi]